MVNNSFNNQKAIIRQLNILVKKFRHKMLLHTLVKLAPWLIVFVIVGSVYTLPFTYFVISIFLVVLLPLYLSIRSERYQKVTLQSLLLHLNRIYPELQESAHLVNSNAASFSILQAIQKERMITQLSKLLENDINNLLPKIPHRHNITSAILALLVLLVVYVDFVWIPILTGQQEVPNKVIDVKNQSKVNINEIDIAESKVLITPPAYTELNKRNQSELNASAISGSLFNWNIVFNLPVDNAFLVFSSGKKVVLDSKKPLSFSVEKQIDYTGVYRIGVVRNEVEYTLPQFYTLTINKDAKAKIKIVTPKKTITEIATNANTAISTHVRITDDFKVDRVEILASIAKGSGESVKFRDQRFLFDRVEVNNGVEHHYKTWQLQDLKMEPGDELYFTVKAWDNRLPQAQMTRSSTKIIRWLEDEQQGVMSDGVLIDFMPEYFKSQRQIILDTIDLINDKGELSTDKFVETSELLGVSQSELKEKYGQYLGDEVEDGGGSHAISHEASEQISNIEEAESTSDNDHHHDEAGGHATDGFEMTGFGTDKSGRAELINQFGHNHEDADIGIMARQDPKALMKRSIANMWQAELHLMLSEPSKALPFEQEALKFLKMAKKAERIYVKRLGFEPPPVSEQRRYQGELDDILTYQRNVNIDLSDSDKAQLSEVFTWLNNVVNKPLLQDTPVLSNYQRQLIVKVKMQFEVLVENRPALIKYVAILERILQANSLILNECRTCLPELLAKIWQLIPDPIAKPHSSRSPYIDSDVLFNKYAEFLSVRP